MVAVTLLEFSNLTQPKLRGAVLKTLVENVKMMDRIKWVSDKALTSTTPYLSNLPSPGFRSLNEAPTEIKATWSQLQETKSILEVNIIVDPVLLMLDSIQNVEAANAEAAVKGIGYFVNEMLLQGDATSDPEEPDGIWRRLRSDPRMNGQTVNATVNTTVLDITPATGTDAERFSYLDKLDEVIAVMNGVSGGEKEGDIQFLCNSQLERNNWSMVRRLKLFDTTKDQFDRVFTSHRGVPFIDVGFLPGDSIDGTFDTEGLVSGRQIISNDADGGAANETLISGNGANDYDNSTSLYCVRFGEDYFYGNQVAPMKVRHLGEDVTNTHQSKVNIRWVFGFGTAQKRSLARLVGLDVSDN